METSTVAPVTFETHPSQYQHWKLAFDGAVATLRCKKKIHLPSCRVADVH